MLRNQIKKGAMDYGYLAEKVHKEFMERKDAVILKMERAQALNLRQNTKVKLSLRWLLAFMESGDWIQTVSNVTELEKESRI